MKKDILLLTISELLFSVAEGSIVVFGMIFFYQKFNSILLAAAPFILLHFFQAFFEPLLGKLIFKMGLKRSLVLGSLFYIATSSIIFAVNGKYSFELLVIWALLYGFANIFHYVPVIYILGIDSKHKSRGKLFGLRRIIFIIAAIVTPVLGGFVSQQYGFQGLISMCITFYIISNIPVIYLSKIETHPPKSLINTLQTMRGKKIFLYKISEVFTNNIGDFWPIYVFIALAGSFSEVGILFAIVSVITIIVTYITSKALDSRSRVKMYTGASIAIFASWIFRAVSFNYVTILLSDIVYRISANFKMQISEVIDFDLMNDHVNQARASIIILNETIVNYLIGFVLFLGALSITIIGFPLSFIIFGFAGFIFMQLMRFFLKKE